MIGLVCVDKRENFIRDMGYVMLDDFNKVPMVATVRFLDERYMYQIKEPSNLLEGNNMKLTTPEMRKKFENLKITDNPIVVKITLK
jgi:hypothetical protein